MTNKEKSVTINVVVAIAVVSSVSLFAAASPSIHWSLSVLILLSGLFTVLLLGAKVPAMRPIVEEAVLEAKCDAERESD